MPQEQTPVDQSTLDASNDPDQIATAVENLASMGYYCAPTRGQGWVVNEETMLEIKERGLPVIQRAYSKYPDAGIGLITAWSADPKWRPIAIDVDTDDPRVIDIVALLMPSLCPCKYGTKGITFFAKARNDIPDIEQILKSRGLGEHYPFAHTDSIDLKWAKGYTLPSGKNKVAEIELLGIARKKNCVIPPSIHPKSQKPYRWVPFPGTDVVGTLEQTPVRDLPEIDEAFVLLLVNLADNLESDLFKFLGQTSEGDYHDKMVQAVFYMYHQRFTEEEIISICGAESALSTDDVLVLASRERDVRKAYHGVRTKHPEPNTARPKSDKKSKADQAERVPDDRLIANWMAKRFERDNTYFFNNIPYTWSELDKRWDPIVDTAHPTPWSTIYEELDRLFPTVESTAIKRGVAWFSSRIQMTTPSPDYKLIPFANGVLDVTTNAFRPEVREDFIPVRLNVTYQPEVTAPKWREFLYNLMLPPSDVDSEHIDEDHIKAIDVLEEFLGYCLVRSHRFRHMLYLIGATSTGKSTLLKVVEAILPKGQVSSVAMENMDDPNYIRMMLNSNINVAAEADRHAKDVDATLLKITSGEAVPVKVLYSDAGSAVVAARLIFHGNRIPNTTDNTGAMAKRMLLLRTTDIRPTVIPEFDKVLLNEAPGIINSLVKAYSRLLARGAFDLPHYSHVITQEMTGEANSVSHWKTEFTRDVTSYNDSDSSEELYAHYKEWCENVASYRTMNLSQWARQLNSMGYGSQNARIMINGTERVVKRRKLALLNPTKVPY